MAHGFNNLGKNTTFATRRQVAWHGLGSVVDSMNSKEAMILGGLDFQVGLAPVLAQIKNPLESTFGIWGWKGIHFKDISTNFATYRKDTHDIFGVVGSRYEPVQNTEAFAFFDSIIGEGHAKYETVGALGNGETVFITAKIPGSLLVGKEQIDKYLLLTMSHDGSGSIRAMFTPIRVVCNNTLSMAVKGARNKVSIRHTKNALNRLEEAKKILGIVQTQTKTMEELFNHFTKVKVNDEDAELVFKRAFGIRPMEDGKLSTRSENKLDLINRSYFEGVGQEGIIGTAWGVYNGVTNYLQNHQNIKGKEDLFTKSFMGKDELIRETTTELLLNIN